MTPPPSALVTGATGFIGGRLAAALVADGARVHALVRASSDRSALPDGVTPVEAPATARELRDVLEPVGAEHVFHLATCFRGVHVTEDVEPLVAANVLFGTQLAEALAAAPPRVLVNVGTAWQSGESGAYEPAALYAATKQAMEDILRFYAQSGSLTVANVRLFDTYGPGDTRGKLLATLDRASRTGEALQMSPGEQLIDLLHVDDVVRALRRAAEAADAPWQTWSASSGRPVSLRRLVDEFGAAVGRPVSVDWGAREYREREMFTPWDAGPPVPGWSPEVALADGIAATFGEERP